MPIFTVPGAYRRLISCCAVYFSCQHSVQASADSQWQAELTLASQYRFKGFAMTSKQPTLQAALRRQVPLADGNFQFGLWASGTRFVNPVINQRIDSELDWQLSRSWQLADNWSCRLDLFHYQYLGGSLASQVNYVEWQAGCGNAQSFITLALTPAYGATSNTHSILSWRQTLWQQGPWQHSFEYSRLRNHSDQQFYRQGRADHYQHLQYTLIYQPAGSNWLLRSYVGSEDDSRALGHLHSGVDWQWLF
jgi:uncharacterized protein (TIGR02001 family)